MVSDQGHIPTRKPGEHSAALKDNQSVDASQSRGGASAGVAFIASARLGRRHSEEMAGGLCKRLTGAKQTT